MSSTTEGRKATGRYAMERALAPHVDEKWAESFIVELRLTGTEGARIGAALSEVESHCSDGGQSAQYAFGSPIEYARSLQLPADDDHSPRAVLQALVPIIVQILAMFMLNWSFENWLGGQRLEITAGRLVNLVGLVLGLLILVRFTDSLLRVAVYHPVRSAILVFFAFLANTATCVAALMLLDSAIWRASAGWGLAVGTATLVGGVVWAILRLGAPGSGEDPILSPLDDARTSSSDPAPSSHTSWLGTLTYTAMIPAATVLLLTTTLVLHQMSPR